MRLAAIGVGQAGGKVLDRLLEYDRSWGYGFVTSATAFNTARADLHGMDYVPEDRRILIGATHAHGHGVGADNELGASIAENDAAVISGALDELPIGRTDAILVIAALGGGTGSGAGPVIASQLSEVYDEPIYGLGILPATNEGGIYSLNAARSLKSFVAETDNLLLFDNDAWREPGESIQRAYAAINDEIVRRFGVLFSAGELSVGAGVAENVVDSSELMNTLRGGGITAVGHAAEEVAPARNGLLSRFRFDDNDGARDYDDHTDRIVGLVRRATRGRLTLPCSVDSAQRALIVVSGPPALLNRRGTELGREWLTEETDVMEVRGGDHPLPNDDRVSATVVISGVTDVPRLNDLQRLAAETKSDIEEKSERQSDDLHSLLYDDHEEIEPIF